MDFLKQFKESMEMNKITLEAKIDKTNAKIDDSNLKMDKKLDNIDREISVLKDKVVQGDKRSKRIDDRLSALEVEMSKSASLKKKSELLRETLTGQPTGRSQSRDNGKQNETREWQQLPPQQHPVEAATALPKSQQKGIGPNPFQSDWARQIQRDLSIDAANSNNIRSQVRQESQDS